MKKHGAIARCFCGRLLTFGDRAAPRLELEVACSCGRRLAFEGGDSTWVYRGSVVREEDSTSAEGTRVPVSGEHDTERYSFEVTEPGPHRAAVHILFSPSRRVAEIIGSDAMPLLLAGISTPTQARRKWFELRHSRGQRRFDSPARTPQKEGK